MVMQTVLSAQWDGRVGLGTSKQERSVEYIDYLVMLLKKIL